MGVKEAISDETSCEVTTRVNKGERFAVTGAYRDNLQALRIFAKHSENSEAKSPKTTLDALMALNF